jgi:hypothetical protein
MKAAERIYRVLLRAYPREFRAEYGREMLQVFRDQCRDNDTRTLSFWAGVLGDVVRSAAAQRIEAWREYIKMMEVIMKPVAILAVLLGLLGIANAVVEWSAGGSGTTAHTLALIFAVGAGVLLFVAGAAIARGVRAGRLALLASVVLIVASRLLHPWMGIFAQLVGIGLPVVLLIALYWPRKPSTFGAASIMLLLTFGFCARSATAQAKTGDTTRAADTLRDLPLPAAQRASFVGTYLVMLPMGGQDVLRIFEENGVLKAYSSHENRTGRLLYQGDGAFRPEGTDFVITFVIEAGRATSFQGRREDGVIKGTRTQ